MKTNNDGVQIIKESEGCELEAYLCPAGRWTIGYGHTSDPFFKVTEGVKITQEYAEVLLKHDTEEAEKILEREYPDYRELSLNQYSALVSFVYNRGSLRMTVGKRTADTTLLKCLKAKQFALAAEELLRWVFDAKKIKRAGLIKRRNREWALFNKL